MDQNAGIAGLAPAAPQQPQMPQAPQQPPAASGVQSYVAPLMGMDMQRLLMEFNNPGSRFPKFAVLSAMQEKQKQAQMRQALQGQQAMAQNAQQGQAPVAAGILAGAQAEAAQETTPQFRYGGAVAMQLGGTPGIQNPDIDEEGLPRSNEDRERILRNNRALLEMQSRAETVKSRNEALERVRATSQAVPEQMQKFYRSTGRDQGAYLGAPATSTDTLFPFGPPESPMMDVPEVTVGSARPPQTARPGAGAPGAVKTPGAVAAQGMDDIVALTKAQEERNKARLELAKTTPEVTAARAAEQRIMQENLQAALGEAKTAREAAEKRRADVIGAASRSILEDPEALFKMAGGIDTRRGMGLRSLAEAAGAELGRRREAVQAAEKAFAGEQKELRALDAANRQYNLSVVQLQKAYTEGDAEKIRAAKQDVADSAVALQEKKMDFKLKQREVGAKEMGAQAEFIKARRPTDFENRLALFRKDPDTYESMFGSKEAQQLARVQQVVGADPLLKQYAEAAKMNMPDAEKKFNARYLMLIKQLAPELAVGMEEGGANAGAGIDLSQWGEPNKKSGK